MADTDPDTTRNELQDLLMERSICFGEFTLKSGKKSDFYVDCRQTTLHSRGAVLIGKVMHQLIRDTEEELGLSADAVGGLTMGADPISVSVAMRCDLDGDEKPLHALCIRKEPKDHGRGKQIEGPFSEGESVVVIDDVITSGISTITAIEAVEREGGKVAFIACLVDRQEGGKQAIEALGHKVVSAYTKEQVRD